MKNRKKLVSILAGVMAAIMLLTLFFCFLPMRAAAASSSEIRKQINALQENRKDIKNQISDLQTQYQQTSDDIADIVARKNVIDQEIGLLHTEIININEQISAYSVLIADQQEELDKAQDRYDELNADCKTRIQAMEERVETAQQELAAEKGELEGTRTELDNAQNELDVKRQEADDLIVQLIAKGEELKQQQIDLEEEDEALLDEIARKEQEYNEAKLEEWLAYMATYVPPTTVAPSIPISNPDGSNSGTNNGSTDSGSSSGGNSSSGGSSNVTVGSSWLVPCSYRMVSSPFGFRESPTTGASKYHQGVDLAAPAGTPIIASRGGTVTVAGYSNSAGYYVTINHGDGFSSIYMHMTNYVVSSGQKVNQGQTIGYVGSTGISTGNHLHFGIAQNGAYVNPCNYVGLY